MYSMKKRAALCVCYNRNHIGQQSWPNTDRRPNMPVGRVKFMDKHDI